MTRTYRYCRWSEIISAFLAGWRWTGNVTASTAASEALQAARAKIKQMFGVNE